MLAPSKNILTTFNQNSTLCCSQMITNNRGSLSEAVKGFVTSDCRADDHDVIEPAAERVAELVHEELRLSRVSRPHDECVEGNISALHIRKLF